MILKPDGTVSPFFALWLPLGVAVLLILLNPLLGPWLELIYREAGIIEFFQPLITLTAAAVGVSILRMRKHPLWLRLWVGGAIVACVYIALEEISYGQHIFKWEAFGIWAEINDQLETNLHNTTSWLDQKPRLVLLIGIIAGGLIIPFVQKKKPDLLPKKFAVVYPSVEFGSIALLVIFTQLCKPIIRLTDFHIYYRPSELNELFMYYFVMVYMIKLRHRLGQPGAF